MNRSEVLTEWAFWQLKPYLFIVDFISRFLGLRFLKSENTKHVVYICCVVGYIYLLKENELAFCDDIILAGCTSVYAYNCLSLVWKRYVEYIYVLFYMIYCRIQVCGKLRTGIYVSSLVLVAALFSFLAVNGVKFASTTFTETMMWRLEDNVIKIEEDRTHFQHALIHPATKGEKHPLLLYKIYRYPMEDVQMSCEFTKLWLAGARPTEYQVVWRRNGVPVTMTDRHKHQLSVEEVGKNDTEIDKLKKSLGLSNYKVKAILTIHILCESDFGSYTCHWAKHMNINLTDYNINYGNKTKRSQSKKQENTKQQNTMPPKQQNEVDKKRLFQDEFHHMGEFRLIKIRRRQEIIRAPASAILDFTTSYWHLSAKDEVEVDYSVNRHSYYDLCRDRYFHGCSKTLLLYWIFWHVNGERFGVPPLQLLSIWNRPDIPAERYTLVHCLCEEAYGYHNVKYLRRYYNTTKQQFELIEVLHPHVLVVVPREQNMLNLFKNRSQCSPIIERPVCKKPRSYCEYSWDFQTIKDFAEAVVTYFHHVEIAAIVVVCVVLTYSIRRIAFFLEFVGRHIRRLSLDGSMAYLATVEGMKQCPQSQHVNELRVQQENKGKRYDVFLSFSETQIDTERVQSHILPLLEHCGFLVCFRDRDLSPNLTELKTLSQAIEISDKFLIFLSAAYVEDHFRKDFEASMIIETLSNRSHGVSSVLLIKLDPCDIPSSLSHLSLQDWTTANLSREDHYLRLLKWLVPPARRWTLRSNRDIFLTILPLLAVAVLTVIILALM